MSDEHEADEPGAPARGEGVQDLIRRLQEEGTEAGRQEAERLVSEARTEAERIRADARSEAERIRAEAREAADGERKAGREALERAYRDTLLCVKEALDAEFRRHLRKLVAHELGQRETLRDLIVAVARDAVPESYRDQERTLELPEKVLTLDDLRQSPEYGEDALGHLAHDIAAGMLGEGVRIERACEEYVGMRIRIEDADVVVELTDEAIAEVLYRHLIPRFRAILDGIVR
jgi:V/A-type H+-transporting ATPase subunit E